MKKRMMSLMLILCMLLSMTVTVSFATGEEVETVTQACTRTGHAEDDGSDWKPLISTITTLKEEKGYTGYVLPGGNYYLEEDITVNYQIQVFDTVNLCLNGKTLTMSQNTTMGLFNVRTGSNSGYTGKSNAVFTICDHNPTKQGTLTCTATSSYTSAVRNSNGAVTINIQAGNFTNFRGAALNNATGGTFNVYGGTFTGNGTANGDNSEAAKCSGAIFSGRSNGTGVLNIYGGEFSNNTAVNGAGIYIYNGSFNMTGGTISGNKATNGGGVYIAAGSATISGGTITGNEATNGGGVYAKAGSVNVSEGSISGNTAAISGGGLYLGGGTHTISGGKIEDNEATGDQTLTDSGRSGQGGGGVYVISKNTVLNMTGGTIANNTANRGGGVYAYYWGIFNMSDGTISGNSVTSATHPAAVYMSATRNVCTLSGGKIVDNNCPGVAAAGKTSVSFEGVNVTGNDGSNQVQIASLADNTDEDTPAGLEHFVYVSDGVIGTIGYSSGSDMAISGGSFGAALPSLASLAEGYSLYHDADKEYPYWAAADAECEHTDTEGIIAAVDATCTEDGITAGVKCSACKAVITLPAAEKAGHTYGELVEATEAVHTATELKAAVAAHYFCDVCDTYFTEAKEATTLEALTAEAPVHAYTVVNGYVAADGHANKCECGAVDTVAPHEPNVDAATEQTAKFCTVCDYVIEPQLAHVHKLTNVPAKGNSCTEAGNTEYWTCGCGKYFSDAEANTEIALADTVIAAGHDTVAHEGKPAAPGMAGWKAYETCTRCDYSTYEEIPAEEIEADEQVTVESFKEAGKAPVSQDGFFGGYYADADKTEAFTGNSGSAYVKFVAKDVLSVKYQVTAGTDATFEKTDLRLVTTVDDLNYREIGFKIYFGDKYAKVSTSTVFSTIVANDGGVAFNEAPSVFHEQSSYFMTYTITDVPAAEFGTDVKVIPYWVTLDGTVQEGVELNFSISDTYTSAR